MTHAEIKAELIENLQYLKETPYPEDMVAELADSNVPIYNGDVIRTWQEMPSDFDDRWKDYGYDTQKNEGGIVKLMQIDLTFYYLEQFSAIWEEIKEEEEN
tara:strand:+ start:310 stop:612 length:303 start_codon:yes stop_codon:yes gene_type:complete